MKTHKVIKFLIPLYLILCAVEGLADYGDSCPTTPISLSGTDDYLKKGTAYGHIIYNIDMRQISDGCDHTDPKFKFCIKQSQKIPGQKDLSISCKPVTLNAGETKTLGVLSDDPQLGGNYLLQNIPLTIKILTGKMCLTMPTSRGEQQVACKPTSISPPPPPVDDQCKSIAKSCYSGPSKSQSLFNFSGVAVECVKDTLDKVFFQYNKCNNKEMNLMSLNPFANFQESLKTVVRMALILYVMFFAINMILTKEYGNLDKIATFIIKLVLVSYFAVGIGPIYFAQGKETQANGMLEYGLPLLTKIAPQFAQIIFNASGSKGLCEFNINKYQPGYSHYGLWDAIDCRIGYYLGLEALYNTASFLKDLPSPTAAGPISGAPINFASPGGDKAVKSLNTPGTFRFFPIMFGFFMAGNIILVASGIAFCVIFTSIVLYFLTNYLVCLITIYVMTYISPIFIPMALFTRTKAYFDAWLKICMSCALQPAVIAGFIALLVTMYDSAIYDNCQFVRYDYTDSNPTGFSTFEIRLPEFDEQRCKDSAGYKLLKYYSGYGWEKHYFLLFEIKQIAKDELSLIVSLLYVLVFSVIFYYFSQSIGQFASEVTGGPNMDAVVAQPTKVVDMVKQGIAYAKAAAEASSGKMPSSAPRQGGAKSTGSSGGNAPKDQSSSGKS
ncbi:type IV secretion system protein [Candidatus Tisiphia endosymbiont of Nemotelus uliginosus]|uniref:type IV secretion system protein n=1 Tax=Candidatus Tisiphia endosymbiont of Nemotelus uliginosus TaxID=3077926 RepID=UPI0035C8A68B